MNATAKRSNRKKTGEPCPIVGTWVSGDKYAKEVEYIVSQTDQGFAVQAVNRTDAESAEVFDITWDGEALSFALTWPSTGRFLTCRLLAVSHDRADYTYTATQKRIWYRKGTEPALSPNRRPPGQRTTGKCWKSGSG